MNRNNDTIKGICMTAKDYLHVYLFENLNEPIPSRIVKIFDMMFLEIDELRRIRNVQHDIGLCKIFVEIETKAQYFIKLLNEIEPFKSEGGLKQNSFSIYISMLNKDLFDNICEVLRVLEISSITNN